MILISEYKFVTEELIFLFLLWINLNFQRYCCSQFFHLNFGKCWSSQRLMFRHQVFFQLKFKPSWPNICVFTMVIKNWKYTLKDKIERTRIEMKKRHQTWIHSHKFRKGCTLILKLWIPQYFSNLILI